MPWLVLFALAATGRWWKQWCEVASGVVKSSPSGLGEACKPGERRMLIANGKGRHQRIVPMSARFLSPWRHTCSSSGRVAVSAKPSWSC